MLAEQHDRPVPSTENMVPLHLPASRSTITPVFCLSHLISFCHLWARLFFPSSPYFFPLFSHFYWCSAFHLSCFSPPFHLHVTLLIPSHLLPSALIPPVFPFLALSEPVPRAIPFPPNRCVSFIPPDSFPLCYPFHSSLSHCLCHIHCHPSLPHGPAISTSHISKCISSDLPVQFHLHFKLISFHLHKKSISFKCALYLQAFHFCTFLCICLSPYSSVLHTVLTIGSLSRHLLSLFTFLLFFVYPSFLSLLSSSAFQPALPLSSAA